MNIAIIARKEPRQARSRAMVDVILTAAGRVLVNEGYEAANTNRIAQVAGVSVGSLYQYFPNKESIIAKLVDRHVQEMRHIIETTMSGNRDLPPLSRLRQLLSAVMAAHREEPELHRVLSEEVPRLGLAYCKDCVADEAKRTIAEFLRENRAHFDVADCDMAAFMIVHMTESAINAALKSRQADLESGVLEREIQRMVEAYIRPLLPAEPVTENA